MKTLAYSKRSLSDNGFGLQYKCFTLFEKISNFIEIQPAKNRKPPFTLTISKQWIIKKFQLAPMGVLAPGSAHARPYDNRFWGFSNGGNKNTRKKKNMENSGLRLSDTVCTATLGPKYAK